MATRIGDHVQSNRMTSLLLSAQSRTREAQAQLGSGNIADRFKGLGPEVERLVNGKALLQQNRSYQTGNANTEKKLLAMESSVSSMIDIVTRARVLAVQRLSDGSADAGLMGPELQGLLDQVVVSLNTDVDGHYAFAGSRTEQRPVNLDPGFTAFGNPDDTYYRGDDLELAIKAADDVDVVYGMSADRDGFRQLIGGMRAFIEGDQTDDRPLMEEALGLLNQSLTNITDYRSELGSRQKQLLDLNSRHADAEIYLELRISEIQHVDVTEAVNRIAQDQVLLESALATIGQLSRLSLADYL